MGGRCRAVGRYERAGLTPARLAGGFGSRFEIARYLGWGEREGRVFGEVVFMGAWLTWW